MIHSVSQRGRRRGMSLVELMVAMTGVSMVLATTAALLHGVMRAQSESRRFIDDERASVRLARQFRADLHAAESMTAAPPIRAAGLVEGDPLRLAAFRFPEGSTVEYSLSAGRDRIVRLAGPPEGRGPMRREDFQFAGPVAVTLASSPDAGGRRWVFSVGPQIPGGEAIDRDPPESTSPPAPRSTAEARRKPPALSVAGEIGRDLRFARPLSGEAAR